MALLVWMPLNGNINNLGTAQVTKTSGTPIFKSGKIGNGLNLNSKVIFNCSALSGCKVFSVAFWAKIEDDSNITTNWQDIISFNDQKSDNSATGVLRAESYYNPVSDAQCGIHWHDNQTCAICDINRNLYHYYGTANRGVWHHCVMMCDSDSYIKVYCDGVFVQEQTVNMKSGHLTGVFHIGDTNVIAGCINDVRIYNRILSDNEISRLSQGLVVHYPLSSQYVIDNVLDLSKYTGNYISAYSNTVTINGDEITINVGSNRTSGVNSQSFNALSTSTFTVDKNNVRFKAFVTDDQDNIFRGIRWTNTTTYDIAIDLAGMVANKSYVVKLKAMLYEGNTTPTKYVQNLGVSRFNNNIEYDVSGFQNNGTKTGTFTYNENTILHRTSCIFNGSDNAIQIPFNNMIGGGSGLNYTVSVWTYKTSIGSKGYQTILGGPSGFELEARNSSATDPVYVGWNWGKPTASYNFNEWTLFTFVHSSTDSKIYVNGQLQATGNSASVPSGNYFIGAWNTSTQQNYEGQLSDFRIYATALSADDVLELYHQGRTTS